MSAKILHDVLLVSELNSIADNPSDNISTIYFKLHQLKLYSPLVEFFKLEFDATHCTPFTRARKFTYFCVAKMNLIELHDKFFQNADHLPNTIGYTIRSLQLLAKFVIHWTLPRAHVLL